MHYKIWGFLRIVLMVTNYPDEPIIPPVRPVVETEEAAAQSDG
jgi:hypothetical protein